MVKNKTCAILNLTADNRYIYPLTYNRPIAALPFASRYRIIDFVLSSLSYADVNSVAMFIGESGRSIYDHVRSGESWDFDSKIAGGIFTFSQQKWKAAHHLENDYEDYYFNHRLFLERSESDYVFVSGSKILANIDIRSMRSHHIESGKDVTIVYKNILASRVGKDDPNERILEFDDHKRLVKLMQNSEKPAVDTVSASMNMYFVSVEFLIDLIDEALANHQYLELDDLIQTKLLEYSVNAYEYTGYAANINSVESYFEANMDMLNHQSFMALFHTSQPVLTKTKNGIPTYYHARSYVRNAIIATGVTIYGEVVDSLLNRRVVVEENANIRNSIILQGAQIGEGARIEYAILDKNVVVEPGISIMGKPDDIKVIAKNERIDVSIK